MDPIVIHLSYSDGATVAVVVTPTGRVVALGRDETDALGWFVRRYGDVLGVTVRWETEEVEAGEPEF